MSIQNNEWFMSIAIEEAIKAYQIGEVPIGALIVNENGKIISQTHNLKETTFDSTGHAEILAIQEAGKNEESWRLTNSTLYVTLEPCPMCLGALQQSRIKKVVFGAYDQKGGAISLGHNLHKDKRMNHTFSIVGGIRHLECSRILSQFFKERRSGYSK